jgi:hypothetical protein
MINEPEILPSIYYESQRTLINRQENPDSFYKNSILSFAQDY